MKHVGLVHKGLLHETDDILDHRGLIHVCASRNRDMILWAADG